jgi:hypothetical protein
VRSKAAGQLSRLVNAAPVITAGETADPVNKSADPPPVDPLIDLETKLAAVTAEATVAKAAYDSLAANLAAALTAKSADDKVLAENDELLAKLAAAAKQLESTAGTVETTVASMAGAADASPAADQVISNAKLLVPRTRAEAKTARDKLAAFTKQVKEFRDEYDDNVQALIALAETAIANGKYAAARRHLDAAAKKLPRGTRLASLDFTYGVLYQRMADATADPAARAKLEQQAIAAYANVAKKGGPLADKARVRGNEVAEGAKAAAP